MIINKPIRVHLTSSQIRDKFEKMPNHLKIKILYEAIDLMQQSNSRNRFHCIAMAMGHDTYLNDGSDEELI